MTKRTDNAIRAALMAATVLALVFALIGYIRVAEDTDAVYIKEWSCDVYDTTSGVRDGTQKVVASFVSAGHRTGYSMTLYPTETAIDEADRTKNRLGNGMAAIRGGDVSDPITPATYDETGIDFNDCATYTKGADTDDPFVSHCGSAKIMMHLGGLGQIITLSLFFVWVLLKMLNVLKETDDPTKNTHRWINPIEILVVVLLITFGVVGLVSGSTSNKVFAEDMTESDNGLFENAWDQYVAMSGWEFGDVNTDLGKAGHVLLTNFADCAEKTPLTYLPAVDFVLWGSLVTLVVGLAALGRKMVKNSDGFKSFAQFQRLI